jgi:hypothetical protein
MLNRQLSMEPAAEKRSSPVRGWLWVSDFAWGLRTVDRVGAMAIENRSVPFFTAIFDPPSSIFNLRAPGGISRPTERSLACSRSFGRGTPNLLIQGIQGSTASGSLVVLLFGSSFGQ